MFRGILGGEIEEEKEKNSIFADFNLDVFISKVNSLSRGYNLQPLFSYIPADVEEIRYRRMITGDFQNPRICEIFGKYSAQVERVKKFEKNAVYHSNWLSSGKWHADALYLFAEAVETVDAELTEIEEYSPAMGELATYLSEYIQSEEFQEWKAVAEEVHEAIDGHTVSFYIQKNKVILEEEKEEEDFTQRMAEAFQVPEAKNQQQERNGEKLSLFEQAVAERVVKGKKLNKKLRQLMDVKLEPAFLKLGYEVQYYLGFYRFVAYMGKQGYSFVLPEESSQIQVSEGYDVAMAVKDEDRKVVRNDFYMGEGEQFFVITGANGGGKTTFARMVGQVLYFSQMGLMVPCSSARLPYFSGILSHFSKEESEETGKGKLMEELIRLRPMMEQDSDNYFVILNELFTTAATLDAGVMGKKVLEHFIQNGCMGIYVTHIQALAEESEHIVSMVAELEKDHHTRSFKIVRKPAKDGEYEDSLITEYSMTYSQIKRVIENEH